MEIAEIRVFFSNHLSISTQNSQDRFPVFLQKQALERYEILKERCKLQDIRNETQRGITILVVDRRRKDQTRFYPRFQRIFRPGAEEVNRPVISIFE